MKSTIHEHQKNNLKRVSKTSIIILGLVALSFTNANAATAFKSLDLDQQEPATLNVENTQQENQLVFVNHETSSANDSISNATDFDLASVVGTSYVQTVEERIAEDKLITESKEENVQPLSLGFTAEDRIAEDNQVIESSISNEVFPLDFERINRSVKAIISNNNAIKVPELKL